MRIFLDYQVGARFEAMDEGVLAAASKSIGYFFAISISQTVGCLASRNDLKLSSEALISSKVKPAKLACRPKCGRGQL